MAIILWIYGIGASVVAIRLGWHMVFKMDRFDWHSSKWDHWAMFAGSVLLWPLFTIITRRLADPLKLFNDTTGYTAQLRRRSQLLESPPLCGPVIRYRQEYGRTGQADGEFFFEAAQVEQVIRQRLGPPPYRLVDDDAGILNWLCQRDDALNVPTEVPSTWMDFKFIAFDLARSGNAKVRCLKCGIDLSQAPIFTNDYKGGYGWSFNRLECTEGHSLLAVESLHVMRPD